MLTPQHKDSNGIRAALAKTRAGLMLRLQQLWQRPGESALLESLEDILLAADLGVQATEQVIATLRLADIANKDMDAEQLRRKLAGVLLDLLHDAPPAAQKISECAPQVTLLAGANGSGKTTTAAKLCRWMQRKNQRVMLAAADTFRAAAIEQLLLWGERVQVPVIHAGQGADPASVAYDALASARARGMDELIIDTAGRQHTHAGLMAELQKIRQVLNKF